MEQQKPKYAIGSRVTRKGSEVPFPIYQVFEIGKDNKGSFIYKVIRITGELQYRKVTIFKEGELK